jgi:hypothetical protein
MILLGDVIIISKAILAKAIAGVTKNPVIRAIKIASSP